MTELSGKSVTPKDFQAIFGYVHSTQAQYVVHTTSHDSVHKLIDCFLKTSQEVKST